MSLPINWLFITVNTYKINRCTTVVSDICNKKPNVQDRVTQDADICMLLPYSLLEPYMYNEVSVGLCLSV